MSVTKHLGRMKTLGAIVTQNLITQVMLLVVFQINSIQKNIKFHEEIFGILSKSIDMITITTYVMSVTKRFGGLKTLSVIVIQNLVKKVREMPYYMYSRRNYKTSKKVNCKQYIMDLQQSEHLGWYIKKNLCQVCSSPMLYQIFKCLLGRFFIPGNQDKFLRLPKCKNHMMDIQQSEDLAGILKTNV